MNAIQQISLKLQLGLDPAASVQPEKLLEQWQTFSEQRIRGRSASRRTNVYRTGNNAASIALPPTD